MKAERDAWHAEFAAVDPRRLVFLDEVGTTDMTRRHGRTPRGNRVEGAVPRAHYKSVTLTAAVRPDGVGACLAFDGATNSNCFEACVERCSVPTPQPGDVVLMNNLAVHKGEAVAEVIHAAGAEVRYLPAYSPDLNPIEQMFSRLKASLRSEAARTVDAVIEAMGVALRAMSPGDLAGWFRSCGYRYDHK